MKNFKCNRCGYSWEKKSNKKDFIIMKAIIFPGINLLWTGCILMIFGSILAIRHRLSQQKENS